MKKIPVALQVSPSLMLFLIHGNQVGMGLVGVQRIIAKSAGYDALFGLFIASMIVHVLIWVMYQLMNRAKGDLVDVQRELFGKWIGGLLNLFLTFFFIATAVSVLRGFLEIIQVWMFQGMETWMVSLLFFGLTYYIVSGGFKIVASIAAFGIIVAYLLLPVNLLPLQYVHFDNLLPMFHHSLPAILQSAQDSSFTFAGFEIILMVYPFIENAPSSQKYAHLGAILTLFILLICIVIPFLFFSETQLSQTIWSLLSMYKVVRFSFLQRWEYVAISVYTGTILSHVTLALWIASRSMKKVFGTKQKYPLLLCIGIAFCTCELLRDRYTINTFVDVFAHIDLYFVALYIPLLTLFYMFYKRKAM